MKTLKAEAEALFRAAMHYADVRAAVVRNLRVDGAQLLVHNRTIDLGMFREVIVIAIGKAATPMYEAAVAVFQRAAWPPERLRAITVSPLRPEFTFGNLTFFAGAHPTPDATSVEAAVSILATLRRASEETLVLFLVSGGASAMVELPIDPTLTFEDVAELNRVLVGSGLAIRDINVLRKHLSAVKGGRMAEAAASACKCTLILSDVPAIHLDSVGSGPSLPDPSTVEDCYELYSILQSAQSLPASVRHFFESRQIAETPKQSNPAFRGASWNCILSSDDLAFGAASAASAAGFHVEVDNRCDEWRCEDAAAYLLHRSAALSKLHGRTCLISAGEVTVQLGQPSGRGGRNQHFALQCALALGCIPRHMAILSAGSDGIDGNSKAAGAVADESTCRRALQLGIDPGEALRAFNSFPLFAALKDSITTGPTGNNLRDLRLLLT